MPENCTRIEALFGPFFVRNAVAMWKSGNQPGRLCWSISGIDPLCTRGRNNLQKAAISFQLSALSFQLGCGGVEGRGGLPGLKIETWGTHVLWLYERFQDLGQPPVGLKFVLASYRYPRSLRRGGRETRLPTLVWNRHRDRGYPPRL